MFMTDISPWVTVLLAFGVAGLLPLSWPVTAVLLTELAGQSRATATGLFAVSNQLGAVGGASLGGGDARPRQFSVGRHVLFSHGSAGGRRALQ